MGHCGGVVLAVVMLLCIFINFDNISASQHTNESGPKKWCVANPKAVLRNLKDAFDWTCSRNGGGVDCGPLEPDQPCYRPYFLLDHASYAFNIYWQKNKHKQGVHCDGVAQITETDPNESGPKKWCVANPKAVLRNLKDAFDWTCSRNGGGVDCGPLEPDQPCYRPYFLLDHASYAFNIYWQKNKHKQGVHCDGVAQITETDPIPLKSRITPEILQIAQAFKA
ncbi:hypothetical protein QJS10_CPA07g00454 [Acorus calamus]|uniref:X8 domain-containing protein n=1 Tax=Acorus calamus TaxID=4465 RepID=A0AAV9EEP8_ACOCL|nr:hypothetical protein QJS10_CPA07g00454 [Acorus calamus]